VRAGEGRGGGERGEGGAGKGQVGGGRKEGINHYSLRKITQQRTHHKHIRTLSTVVLS